MHEILIHRMNNGIDGNLTSLSDGLQLPATPEAIEEMMAGVHISKPYIARSYTFRLNELNVQIIAPQPLDELNSLATMLAGMSEYERVKLEGAAMLTGAETPEDCVRLIYNLDNFELTPNVGDYESLGKHFAENDFADSFKDVPPEMMAHFDYALLGRMGWDDSTNVLINGHRIRDTENELLEYDLLFDPLAAYMKMQLFSDKNHDGVWIKFPLSGLNAIDAPERSDEMAVALKSPGIQSIEDARLKRCECIYPVLTKCMEYSEGDTLTNLIFKAHNLGLAESELSQYGKDAHDKFAAALEYEDSGDLDFAADISQNLNCYDFAPNIEAWAEKCLLKKGVDSMLTHCFDLKTLGDQLAAENGAVITKTGVIARNEQEFIFDYFQSARQENHTQENVNEYERQFICSSTQLQSNQIRLFCPLKVATDPESTLGEEYGEIVSEFENVTIPNSVAADYANEINTAIQKEMNPEEQERGLALYLDSPLADKVSYIWPNVEVHNDELWGVFNIKTETLTEQEMADLTDYCIGQASDGLGEGVEQHPVKTQDGDLYVSLWQSGDDYFMKPEQEFMQMFSEQEQTMQMDM